MSNTNFLKKYLEIKFKYVFQIVWVRSLVNRLVGLATQPLRGDVLAMNPTITTMPMC